jgi:NTP pyrophosphatase (non-canonical NTP hydrolase)
MTPTEQQHAALVARTCKPGHKIVMSGDDAHLVHMALGIAGEAGELVDAIKKRAIHGHALNLTNVIEELGDIEWYMEGLRAKLHITRDYILQYNMEKLNKRYPVAYSDKAAAARADKK